jgi:hypothetical protein
VRRWSSRETYLLSEMIPEGDAVADDPMPDDKPTGGDGAGKNADLEMIIEAVRMLPGVNIPDEVSDWKQLAIAIKASAAGREEEPEPMPEGEPTGDNPPGGNTQAGTSPPMLMSTTPAAPPPDAMPERIVAGDRRALKGRVERLWRTGRVNGPIYRKLCRDLTGASLSYTAAGELAPCALTLAVKAYEALPRGQVWSEDQRKRDAADRDREAALLSQVTEVPPPGELADTAARRAAEAAEDMAKYAAKYSGGMARPVV